jgi:hypothetical protein
MDFLGDDNVFSSNKGLPDGVDHQKDQAFMIRSLERGEGLEIE